MYVLLVNSESKSENLKVLLDALVSDQALLHPMFRLGIYQDVPGSPFTGMRATESPHPAKAMRLFFAAVYKEAPEETRLQETSGTVINVWGTVLRLAIDGYGFLKYVGIILFWTDWAQQLSRRHQSRLAIEQPPRKRRKGVYSTPVHRITLMRSLRQCSPASRVSNITLTRLKLIIPCSTEVNCDLSRWC
jgi:hypothetical protein